MTTSCQHPPQAASIEPSSALRVLCRIVKLSLGIVAAVALFGGDCQARMFDPGVLDPAGPVGAGDKALMLGALVIMLAVVIPVIIMTVIFVWWFRASNPKAKYLPDWEYSGRIEIVVWSIPAMVVLFLGGLGWIGSHELDPGHKLASKEKPLQVQVVSMDWKWLFIYPDQGIASVNQLMVPVGVPVEFTLTSADVMNSFFIPRLGSQIYTMAGMTTHLFLEASKAGTFPGISAQYSGDGFSDMHFTAIAVPPDQFASWVATNRNAGPVLDQKTYETMLAPTMREPVATYHGVQPGFFNKIIAMSVPGTMTGALGETSDNPASSPSPHPVKE